MKIKHTIGLDGEIGIIIVDDGNEIFVPEERRDFLLRELLKSMGIFDGLVRVVLSTHCAVETGNEMIRNQATYHQFDRTTRHVLFAVEDILPVLDRALRKVDGDHGN